MRSLEHIRRELAGHGGLWLTLVLAFVLMFHLAQAALLVARFGEWPNYVTVHDWPHNVVTIIRSTPSMTDTARIILDEWLIEVGYMNYDYGHGIAEWSFVILPAKLAFVVLLAAVVSANIVLLRSARFLCSAPALVASGTATLAGAVVAGGTAVTMTWVVCCAAPTWVVGLSIMGLSVPTAFALQPFGTWLAVTALGILTATAVLLMRRLNRQSDWANVPSSAALLIGEWSCRPAP
jgi:hypothetical protein